MSGRDLSSAVDSVSHRQGGTGLELRGDDHIWCAGCKLGCRPERVQLPWLSAMMAWCLSSMAVVALLICIDVATLPIILQTLHDWRSLLVGFCGAVAAKFAIAGVTLLKCFIWSQHDNFQ